jgi:hypothetical protein
MIRSAGARAASRGPAPEVLHGWVDVHGELDGHREAMASTTALRPPPPVGGIDLGRLA